MSPIHITTCLTRSDVESTHRKPDVRFHTGKLPYSNALRSQSRNLLKTLVFARKQARLTKQSVEATTAIPEQPFVNYLNYVLFVVSHF